MRNYNDVKFAGFWMRFAALLVDQAFLGFGLAVLFTVLTVCSVVFTSITLEDMTLFIDQLDAAGSSDPDIETQGTFAEKVHYAQMPLYIVVSIFYHSILEAMKFQGSFGKFILKLRVVTVNGMPTSFFRSFFRNFLAWVLGICTLSISHWFAGFTKKKRALHDIITGCVVVRES